MTSNQRLRCAPQAASSKVVLSTLSLGLIMLDLNNIQFSELLEQILDKHYYEAISLLVLLLTVIVLRLFSIFVSIRWTFKMPAASPATVRPPSTVQHGCRVVDAILTCYR